ncbi:MAG: hypothetical protein ACXABY_27655 [Candidatus Thorarchaeota archaeon]|jgi:hypothetical protein
MKLTFEGTADELWEVQKVIETFVEEYLMDLREAYGPKDEVQKPVPWTYTGGASIGV